MNASLFDYKQDTRQKTEEWLRLNPQVWSLFQRFALEKVRQNRPFGVKALIERVRWDVPIQTEGNEFKICNSFAPYIARKLIETYPQMKDFIVTRKTKW
jgi:hypothetical protein